MAQADTGSGEPFKASWYSHERLIDEVHRAETAIAALKQIDHIVRDLDKPSGRIIRRIIAKALQNEL